jgi:cytidylate kinase
MGTVVFPDADLKIYLDANIEIRAKRRQLELQKRGQEVNIHDLMTDILERDNKDMRRDISPLRKADDAFTIDSSNLSSEQVLNNAIDEIKKRGLI